METEIKETNTKQMHFSFVVPGKVKAKQSMRFTRAGIRYTPKDMTEYANWVKICFREKYPKHKFYMLIDYMLCMHITVYYHIPKSFSKKKKELAMQELILPTTKPDWDNIAKNICDALNGVVYPDDKAIVTGSVKKVYSDLGDCVTVDIYATKKEV